VKKIEFGEHWRNAGLAATAIEFCIGALDARPLVMSRALFHDFVRLYKS
jgi:hypothetical protein